MAEYKLVDEMLLISESATWDTAKYEWGLEYIREGKSTCLCGHFPIKEICILKNKLNDKRCEVGNVCVKKFTDLPSNLIFGAIKRISKNIDKSVNLETIAFAFDAKWINDFESGFYSDKYKKRNLSDRQLALKKQINQIIIDKFSNGGNDQKSQESKPKLPPPILKVQNNHETNCQAFVPKLALPILKPLRSKSVIIPDKALVEVGTIALDTIAVS